MFVPVFCVLFCLFVLFDSVCACFVWFALLVLCVVSCFMCVTLFGCVGVCVFFVCALLCLCYAFVLCSVCVGCCV